MWNVKYVNVLLVGINITIYSMLLMGLGSCSHFSTVEQASKYEINLDDPNVAVMSLQYSLKNVKDKNHSLYFRDSAGDLMQVEVDATTNTEAGVVIEAPVNRSFKLESVELDAIYELGDLSKSFFLKQGRLNHLGLMSFEVQSEELIFNMESPKKQVESMRLLSKQLGIHTSDVSNPYTRKVYPKSLNPTLLKVNYGSMKNSFSDYIRNVNECYVEEWRRNPVILGQLDFTVTADDGVLRIHNSNSKHTASKDFEECVWTSIANSEVNDQKFQVKLPGILYF
ncbi:MAG: hypothetical protein AB8E15_08365 [Bdellovibrionales bacterium]